MTACHRAWVEGGVEELEALDDEDRVLGMLPREPFTLIEHAVDKSSLACVFHVEQFREQV